MDQIARDYWNNRYSSGGNSGYGSYGEQLMKKLTWLDNLEINSISEIGCGDFNFGRNLIDIYHVPYTGQDISSVALQKALEVETEPRAKFTSEMTELPCADLLLCIDVLFHVLDDDEYDNILNFIASKWTKYLAITAYEGEQETAGHLKIRKFDYSRFGKPLIREIVEEDGQLYFYLFKKPSFDITRASACLITKESTYPEPVLQNVMKYPFGEITVLTHCDSPHRKQELFSKATYDWIYYQDDDCIAPIAQLIEQSGEGITCAMKASHLESYKHSRIALLGWGSIFPKSAIYVLDKYREKYGEDQVYKRESERIMTYLNYPQRRLDLPITDLPSAFAPDRLSMQPGHYDFIPIVEERCASL